MGSGVGREDVMADSGRIRATAPIVVTVVAMLGLATAALWMEDRTKSFVESAVVDLEGTVPEPVPQPEPEPGPEPGPEPVPEPEPEPKPVPESDPEPTISPVERAARIEAEIVASSALPFLRFDQLPVRIREEQPQSRNRALFLEYPENRWGEDDIGIVRYRVKDPDPEGIWPLAPLLDDENAPLLLRYAEIVFEMQTLLEERIERLVDQGRFRKVADRAAAHAHIRSLGSPVPGPSVRIDPETGEAYVFDWHDVHGDLNWESLVAEKEKIGKQLVGRNGSHGVLWRWWEESP